MNRVRSAAGAWRARWLKWIGCFAVATTLAGTRPTLAAVQYPSGVGPIRVAFAKVVGENNRYVPGIPGGPAEVGPEDLIARPPLQDLYAGFLGSTEYQRLSGDGTHTGPFSREFYEIDFSPNARWFAVGGRTNEDDDLRNESGDSIVSQQAIWVTDMQTKRTRRVSPPWRSPTTGNIIEVVRDYTAAVWTTDSRTIVATKYLSDREAPAALDVLTGKPVPLTAPMRALWEQTRSRTVVSPNGKRKAKAEMSPPVHDRVAAKIAIASGKSMVVSQSFPANGRVKSITWTPDGHHVVALSVGNDLDGPDSWRVHLIRASDGRAIRSLPLHNSFGHVGFSRNGRWLIALDGTDLVLWDWRTGEKRLLPGPKCRVAAMDWVELPARR
jgi:hypothetical protein